MEREKIIKGREGESRAAEFLLRSGYEIIDRNFRTRFGEIDIIAKDKNTIVFVEVRRRKDINFGTPEESVNFKKRSKITKVAACYIRDKKLFNHNFRFDILSITEFSIKHIKGAFNATTCYYF